MSTTQWVITLGPLAWVLLRNVGTRFVLMALAMVLVRPVSTFAVLRRAAHPAVTIG
ncbi:hypothetical protein HC031_05320 [Planosporangium thailandense]|uniref:Uncharacterized protein n=1 Tax=Planosporangium thailandense TaxID=765197 RepID=A0ABX0XV60_9ACTN|nr:hypothetical protein [Planosporangium thailandense]NJC69140.1 hypothetical protein [Planosporangium thailandense]